MDDFPARVTLFADGVYRWSYDLDMRRNLEPLRLVLKVISLILGVPALFCAAMTLRTALAHPGAAREGMMFYLGDDLLLLAVVGGLWMGCILLTLVIYAACAALMRGTWRWRYEMDASAVTLVQSAATKARNDALAAVADAASSLSGRSDRAAASLLATLRTANGAGTTRFESVRRVRLRPAQDLIDLRAFFGGNLIYVSAEDYPFVRDFILSRVKEKARP